MIDETLVQTYYYIQGINFLAGIIVFVVLMIIAAISTLIKEYFLKKRLDKYFDEKMKKKYNKK